MRADEIARLLQVKHTNSRELFWTQVKNGPTGSPGLVILDGLAVKPSYNKMVLTGYEIKVSRSDFKNDSKWVAYLPLCHRFYFVCPPGIIEVDDIEQSATVGLIWVEDGKLRTKKKATTRCITPPFEMLQYIIFCRSDAERHPFFTDDQAREKAWLESKEELESLYLSVETELSSRYNKVVGELKQVKHRLEMTEENLKSLKIALADAGLPDYAWGITSAVKNLAPKQNDLGFEVEDCVKDLNRISERCARAAKKVKEYGDKIKGE